MVKNIRHIGIVVSDLKSSLCFYRDILGFKVAKQLNESSKYIDTLLGLRNVNVTTVKMTCSSGQMIELLYFKIPPCTTESRPIYTVGPTHISFTIGDLEKEYQKFTKVGVQFVSEPVVSPDGYAKVAFCRAPEGTFIELVEVL